MHARTTIRETTQKCEIPTRKQTRNANRYEDKLTAQIQDTLYLVQMLISIFRFTSRFVSSQGLRVAFQNLFPVKFKNKLLQS
jgi:hypothetical protein